MSVFVLVHGAFHGRWCFRRLTAALEAQGHKSVAIDLPGHGDCEIDPKTVSMDDYVSSVCRTIDTIEHEQPILVGHSMGGLVVSQVAERYSDRLAGLSYICAYLPKSGESLMSIEARNPAPRLTTAVTPAPDMTLAHINAELAAPVFYNDCSESDLRNSAAKLADQPGAPFLTPVSLTEEAFGTVPKQYFLCEKDQTIPAALQEEMIAARSDVDVVRLDSGHSPFLSRAEELAAALIDYAAVLTAKGRRAAA